MAVAVADKPTGPYTDKGALICQEMGSIDAFFVRDENDKPFLVWKEDGNDRRQPTWLMPRTHGRRHEIERQTEKAFPQ